MTQDNKSIGKSSAVSGYPGTSSNRSSVKVSHKTNSILILSTIGVFSVIAVFVAIYLLSDNGSDNPANSDPLKSVTEKKEPSNASSVLTQNHILKISILGNVDKLIVCDEGNLQISFMNSTLYQRLEQRIILSKSFRCYSSNIENIIFQWTMDNPRKWVVIGKNRYL